MPLMHASWKRAGGMLTCLVLACMHSLYMQWQPFSNVYVNYVRCASYAIVFYAAVLLVAIAFPPSYIDDSQVGKDCASCSLLLGHMHGSGVRGHLVSYTRRCRRIKLSLQTPCMVASCPWPCWAGWAAGCASASTWSQSAGALSGCCSAFAPG